MQLLIGLVLVVTLTICLFALIILVGFAFLLVKSMEGAYGDTYTSQTISEGDELPTSPTSDEIPLDQFKPDYKKRVRVVYKETPVGVEETEEVL